jgi:hypothetical protein
MTQAIKIHSQVSGANAIKAVGEVVIACKWKETAKQTPKERAVIVPMEAITVTSAEVSESFKALVEAVLLSTAQDTLKGFINASGDNCFEVPGELFFRTNLVENFLSRDSNWMSKEELELGFTASATWKRIAGRTEYTTNKAYQNAANSFKDTILKLSGKAVQIPVDRCELLLSKIADEDLVTEFGCFVAKRLQTLKEKSVEGFDLSAL